MYIESVPNRHSPPAILLRESYREGGRVKKRTLLNLSDWPADRIAGFKMLLKGGTVVPSDQQAITIIRSLPHGTSLPPSERRARSVSTACSARTATAVAILSGPRRQPSARSRLQACRRPRAVAGHGQL